MDSAWVGACILYTTLAVPPTTNSKSPPSRLAALGNFRNLGYILDHQR